MGGLRKISLLLLTITTLQDVTSTNVKEKVLHIPEKIIGGVIDIVQNHKNKPNQQGSYPNNQYPSYQNQQNSQYQWNQNSNYQSQHQQQYQGQSYPQNGGSYPATYPQNGGNYPANNQVYPVSQSGYGSGQTQSQGQYQTYPNQQGQYQAQNQQGGQYQGQNQGQYQNQQGQYTGSQQPTGQYQGANQQVTGQYQGNQQTTGQYQGSNQQNQMSTGQYQGTNHQTTGQYQGHGGQFTVVSQGSSGTIQSGSNVPNGSASGAGPTCICQAWTKPEADEVTTASVAKPEKSGDVKRKSSYYSSYMNL